MSSCHAYKVEVLLGLKTKETSDDMEPTWRKQFATLYTAALCV